MSLAASGIKLERREDEYGWLRAQRARFFPCKLHLALFEQAVFRAEGNNHAFGFCSFSFGIGVQPAGSGQGFHTGEINSVSTFAANAGFQQLVAPFGVPQRGSRPRHRGV